MHALILAAGYATRLYPLTEHTPKPLLLVKGKPMINHIVEKILEVEVIQEITVITNNKFYDQFVAWQKTAAFQKPIRIINDLTLNNTDRLGAIGDINFAIKQKKINDDLLIIAGDNLFTFSLVDFIRFFHEKKASALAIFDTHDKKKIEKLLGCVELDHQQKIVSFEEKPQHPKTTLAATFCYAFTKEDLIILDHCLQEKQKLDNGGDFIRYLTQRKPVYGFTFSGKWYDIGSKEQYELVK